MHNLYQFFIIICFFLLAGVGEIINIPSAWVMFRPQFILLTLFYWQLAKPELMGLSITFIIGILLDLLTGSYLGTHSLVLLFFSYFVLSKIRMFKALSMLQQATFIFLYCLFFQFFVALIVLFNQSLFIFHAGIIFSSITSAFVWLFLHQFLHRYH